MEENVIPIRKESAGRDLTSFSALSPEASKMLKELIPAFEGLQLGMSGHQIEEGVLRVDEFPTPDSKYWQCIREIHTRYGALVNDQYNINKLKLEIENAEIQIESYNEHGQVLTKNQVKQKMNAIAQIENDVALRRFNAQELQRRLEDTMRQVVKFAELMEKWGKLREYRTKEESEMDYWRAVDHIRKEKENREGIRQIELAAEVQRRLQDRLVVLQPERKIQ